MTASISPLLQSINASPEGLSLGEVLSLHPGVARRTAQRWLQAQVDAGLLSVLGAGRSHRYVAVNTPAQTETSLNNFPVSIPLSTDSREVLAYVQQAVLQRKPVGYQREFLDAYQPNHTWYLPEPLRRQLRNMGETGVGTEPAGTYGRAVLNRLLIDLSWASSHLEGNTYTRLDTRELLEYGRAAEGKAALETQMILNHKAAIELLVDNIATVGFDRYTLFNLHSALAENLLPNPSDEGRLRQHAVEIGKSVYRPLAQAAWVDELFDQLLNKLAQIADPFEQAFFAMVHLPYLQPFADINKRTSRLLANLPLLRANLCPLTFLDVPEAAYSLGILGVYEMTRVELLRDVFVWAYQRSTQEYVALKQDVSQPDPVRLAYRDVIKSSIRQIVQHPQQDALSLIAQTAQTYAKPADQAAVTALIIAELSRIHEGVLARYGLRLSEYAAWKALQDNVF